MPRDSKRDIAIQSYQMIQNQKILEQIKSKIPEWRNGALAHQHDRDWWPVKYAKVQFSVPEGQYDIEPGDLGHDVDAYMFERVSAVIVEELINMGAKDVQYSGSLD